MFSLATYIFRKDDHSGIGLGIECKIILLISNTWIKTLNWQKTKPHDSEQTLILL